MDKPFLDIDGQVRKLRARGLRVDGETAKILLREGYYSVVNGYKDPFIDIEATKKAGDDRYKQGTSFADLYTLFRFDRDLRETTFHYLLQVEAIVRTVCSHVFADNHREAEAYMFQSNFASENEYLRFGLSNYVDNMQKLQAALYNAKSSNKNEAVKHYRNEMGWVPMWVLSKSLTFGNIEHFFNLMKPEEQKAVCKKIAEAVGRAGGNNPYFSPRDARLAIDPLVAFRNICAHDDRLYCARVGGRRSINYNQMMDLAEKFLTEEEFDSFMKDVLITVSSFSSESNVVAHILKETGFRNKLPRLSRVLTME